MNYFMIVFLISLLILYLLEKVHPKLGRVHFPLAVAGWIILIGLLVYATILDIGKYVI